ncbi:MarR family winged helix-turn-helix transcriptional regulator [Microbacterium phyllosphaerae]|uniref:MarR family winged helix-turn-helix transcriptional regulator n=1 Tax=Microbacterium phyllosphaerae TaxID=124798 RepID=UPI003D6545CC
MTRNLLEIAVVATQSVVMQANDRLDTALAEHHLTHATAQALWAIDPESEPPSMKSIAQRLFCNAPNLTFVMNQLADRSLIERVVDPNDRRSRLVSLTKQGGYVREAIIDAALATSPLAQLPPEALEQLITILGTALDSAPSTQDPSED